MDICYTEVKRGGGTAKVKVSGLGGSFSYISLGHPFSANTAIWGEKLPKV